MVDIDFGASLRAAAGKLQDKANEDRWRNDPVAWAEEKMGLILWSKQKEILTSLAQNKRTAVKSCHSIGKTFISSVAACWWVSTRPQCMVQSTAPTFAQVHSLLWEEIRRLHTRMGLVGTIDQKDRWQVQYSHDGRAKPMLVGEGKKPADTNIHAFQGTHRKDGVLVIIDEACGLVESIYTGAEAITTSRVDRILAVGNPDDPNTEFGRIFEEGDGEWNLITVSAYDTPNFTGEAEQLLDLARKLDKDRDLVREVNEHDKTEYNNPHMEKVLSIVEHMPDPEWIESRKRDWGEDSPRFLSKVLAQFPKTSIDSLFSGSDIETARNNIIVPDDNDFRVMGVDVARYGGDRTVVALNTAGHIEIVAAYNSMDTMEVSAQVHKLALQHKVDQVRVDGIGVGAGVVDRLTMLSRGAGNKYTVVEMTAGSAAPDRSLHRNARAYWYDTLKYQMRNGRIDLPDNANLTVDEYGEHVTKFDHAKALLSELTTIRYAYPNGTMQIESKEDIRRRGGKSPDFVDAVVMACAPINNIVEDPLSVYRPGQEIEIDALAGIDTLVSLF